MGKIFAVYKPKGPTSHDILKEIRKITGIKKVGHAGTLDPLAEGVLVVAVGREATKKLKDIVGKEKEYLATICLGTESTTDDAEGQKTNIAVAHKPSAAEIETARKKFVGRIEQVPPIYSAVKVSGREAYKLARRGESVELKARAVEVRKISILKYHWPYLKLRIVTGPGVYIRSLARDLGRELKTGGYLYALERTRVGEFTKAKTTKITACKLSSAKPAKNNLIRVSSPQPNQIITSPLTVAGKARGFWFFEASFPVRLLDDKGNQIAVTPAQAEGEWMTENFVPFKAILLFSPPLSDTGTLVLEKDNPSGLPENAQEVRVPVRFR